MRNICSVPEASEQYTHLHGQKSRTLQRDNILVEAAACDLFGCNSKPKPLVANLFGYWSRRIDRPQASVSGQG